MKLNSRYKFTSKYAAFIAGVFACLFLGSAHADVTADIAKVRTELGKMFPGRVNSDTEILESAVDSVYRIEFQGSYAFAYADGDHVLIGNLFNTKELVDVGEAATNAKMAKSIEAIPTSKMIVYGPEKPKRYITVFTDIDCGFCRKLHGEVTALNDAGIQVRYVAFPRAGVGSESYNKYVSVWCNDDQQGSLTAAKFGQNIPAATCDNPVTETYKLGQEIGVRGTPMIVFDDGTISPGYLPSAELIRRLGV